MSESKHIEQEQHVNSASAKRRSAVKDITRVISFTSGKGGVGKTNTVVNTAMALGRQGRRVLMLDADLGLANIDILLGISPKYNLQDVLNGDRSIDEIIVDGPMGISIIPAASGIESICDLSTSQKMLLMQEIESIALDYDYLLIDTRAGISSDVMYFNAASSEVVVVINAEPTSLTDAYAVIKVLSTNYGEKHFSVVSNDVSGEREGRWAFDQLQSAVGRFLRVNLQYMGSIPTDAAVSQAIRQRRAVLELYPSSAAGVAYGMLAKKLEDESWSPKAKGGMQFFFRQIMELEHAVA